MSTSHSSPKLPTVYLCSRYHFFPRIFPSIAGRFSVSSRFFYPEILPVSDDRNLGVILRAEILKMYAIIYLKSSFD